MKFYSHENVLDKHIGRKGTRKRDAFEKAVERKLKTYTTMKVYKTTPTDTYFHGIVLVAARNEQEAKDVLDSYYEEFEEFDEFEEVSELTANVKEPCILISQIYLE